MVENSFSDKDAREVLGKDKVHKTLASPSEIEIGTPMPMKRNRRMKSKEVIMAPEFRLSSLAIEKPELIGSLAREIKAEFFPRPNPPGELEEADPKEGKPKGKDAE